MGCILLRGGGVLVCFIKEEEAQKRLWGITSGYKTLKGTAYVSRKNIRIFIIS